MSKTSGALELPKVVQWTRAGFVGGTWGPHESFEALVFAPVLRARLQKLALGFLSAQEICSKARVCWRRGALVWGPPGSGKTAVTRAIALLTGWRHVTITAAEMLDAHHLVRALHESAAAQTVAVIENLDELLRKIDPGFFFDAFDAVSNRVDGVFWAATTRHPEDLPKNQLVRPGRFDDSLRVSWPNAEEKRAYYEAYVGPFLSGLGEDSEALKQELLSLLESNENLSFAHLQELRTLMVRVLMDGDSARLGGELQSFCREQVISANRWGGKRAVIDELEERVRLVDPRHLLSALQVTDAFKRIVELTVGTAAEAFQASAEGQAKKY